MASNTGLVSRPLWLERALVDIGGSIISFSYKLDRAACLGRSLCIFNDLDPVLFDRQGGEGWYDDPDTHTIAFHGSSCDKLQNDEVWDIDVVFGCNGPVPE